jgi:hypothetical protein
MDMMDAGSNSVNNTLYVEKTGVDTMVLDTRFQPSTLPSDYNADPKVILGRPFMIFRGDYSPSLPVVVFRRQIDSTTVYNVFPYLSNLKNIVGWRATMCFKAQTITNPFNVGMFKLGWQPEPASGGLDRGANKCGAFMLPGPLWSTEDTDNAVIRVPYVHTFDYLPFTSRPWSYGILTLNSLTNAVSAPTNNTMSVAIRAWLEDVEFIGANTTSPLTLTYQSSLEKKLPPTEKESMVYSKALTKISAATAAVSGLGIPYISSVSGVASWLTAILSKAAAAFGYSKPIVNVPMVRNCRTTNNYLCNSDGPDVTASLGVLLANKITPLSDFCGTNLDEMAISYITSRPSMLGKFAYSTSTNTNSCVWGTEVCPIVFFFNAGIPHQLSTATFTDKSCIYPTNLMYLANAFRYWRGTTKFTFMCCKTKFHTGRLLVSFIPSISTSLSTGIYPDIANQPLTANSVLWDLSISNSIEYSVPFIWQEQYSETNQSIGTISVVAETPLNAPSTVSTAVEIIVTVSGDEDYEFSIPITCRYYPAPPTGSVLLYQSGLKEPATCMGEKVMSIKQLLNIMTVFRTNPVGDVTVNPWFTNRYAQWAAANTDVPRCIYTDIGWCEYFTQVYNYARGSTRVHFKNNGDGIFSLTLQPGFY